MQGHSKFHASLSTAIRAGDLVPLGPPDLLIQVEWSILTTNLTGMDVFVKRQAVIFYYCFFNTVLQNTFSLFEQLASIRQAFGENSQLYVFCNEIWYGVISFLWSVIKLLDLVFVVEVLSLLRSDLSFGEEQYRCSQWNVYSILGFKALVEMLTLIYWHKQKRGSEFLCIKDGAHKTNGHLIEEGPNHFVDFQRIP